MTVCMEVDPLPCPVCGGPTHPDDSPVGPQDVVVCRDCLPDAPAIDEYDDLKDREAGL